MRAEEPGATRTVESDSTGTVTGAQGGEGVTTRESSKTYSNEQGKQVTVEKSGTAAKNADGSVAYQGTRTVTNPKGETRSFETTGSTKLTTAEDGTRTREGSHVTTNTETGRSRTVENSTTVKPTENGKTFTNDRKVENSAGGSHTSHTEGQVTRNGDGTGSATSHTDRQGTTARGKTWSGSTDRKGSYKRSDGGVHAERSVTHSGSRRGGAHRR